MNLALVKSGTRVHRCDECGNVGPWGTTWAIYGSIAHQDAGFREWITCSQECREKKTTAQLNAIIGKVRFGAGTPHLKDSNWSLVGEGE